MVSEIEEYNEETNIWKIILIRDSQLWSPVEVCACIQVSREKIFIFGGSDVRIKDSNNVLMFNIKDYSIEKKKELKRS